MQQPEHTPYDASVLRWLVASQSDERVEYLVQLVPPECQCRYWVCEVAPKLKRNEKPRQMCAHYREADRRFSEYAKWAFYQYEKNKKQNETT